MYLLYEACIWIAWGLERKERRQSMLPPPEGPMSRLISCFLALFALSALAQLPTYDPPRDWKMADGQPFKASVLSFDGKVAAFRMPNGQKAEAPVEKLSAEDQAYPG